MAWGVMFQGFEVRESCLLGPDSPTENVGQPQQTSILFSPLACMLISSNASVQGSLLVLGRVLRPKENKKEGIH